MGKRDVIRSIINSVSLVAYHKVIYEKGERTEAKKHLDDEIRNYSADGFEKAQLYRFSKAELQEIMKHSVARAIAILRNRYPDVKFSDDVLSPFS